MAAPRTVGPTTWCTYKVVNIVDDYLFVYGSRSTSDHIGDFTRQDRQRPSRQRRQRRQGVEVRYWRQQRTTKMATP